MSVGERVRLARKGAGLSQRELAARSDLSAMAISKYERDLMVPSSRALLAIAKALGVGIEFLLRTTQVELAAPAYRSRQSLGVKAQAAVLARAQAHIERYFEVEELLGIEEGFREPVREMSPVASIEDVEGVADAVRAEWDLGEDPIENLMEVLEGNGIKVALVDADSAFDALIAQSSQGAPVVVVRTGIPGDRQRFSMAHELGHLLVKHGEDLDAEKVAYRFAGAFLVPKSAAVEELGAQRSRLDVMGELCPLKRKYGMSIAAWAYRAKDLDIITDRYFASFNKLLRVKGWHREEPCPLDPESTSRFMRLVQRAAAEGIVSRTKAMELVAQPM